jgi:hypothetical protein
MNTPNPTRQCTVDFWRQPYKAELFIHKKPTGAGWAICTHPHNSFPPYTPPGIKRKNGKKEIL